MHVDFHSCFIGAVKSSPKAPVHVNAIPYWKSTTTGGTRSSPCIFQVVDLYPPSIRSIPLLLAAPTLAHTIQDYIWRKSVVSGRVKLETLMCN